ncbi:MAG: OmpA family protein [Pseudomonadota bacterium]
MIRALALAMSVLAWPAVAFEPRLPQTARLTVERNTGPDLYAAPVGAFGAAGVPTRDIEGSVSRRAWRIASPGLTPLQVMRPLREQLLAAGYDIVLDCAAQTCGGFDFRFAIETLPGPNMYVNIRSFHVVTAVRGKADAPDAVVTLLASSAAAASYVQIIRATRDIADAGEVAEAPSAPLPQTADLAEGLTRQGHVVLPGLDFATGSSDLSPGPYPALTELAAYLNANPSLRVALVGHTDNVGELEPNIAISRARAQSVRVRLINDYDVPEDQLDAEGMGYLAPIASNLTPAGRERNRRVEVVLLER